MTEFSDYPRITLIGWLLKAFGLVVLWLCAVAFLVTLVAGWWALDQVRVD